MAPVGARDISCVGVDGLSRMFGDTLVIEKEVTLPDDADDAHKSKEKIKDASEPKSSVSGSCKCCKKNANFASRQFDRSPIKKIDGGSQACVASLRKQFHDLGKLIKSSRGLKMYEIQEESTNPIRIAAQRVHTSIVATGKSFGGLMLVLDLAKVCAQPNVLCTQFGVQKTKLLLQYTGEFLGQLADGGACPLCLRHVHSLSGLGPQVACKREVPLICPEIVNLVTNWISCNLICNKLA